MTITVIGMPGPQGSKAFKGIHGGHAVLVESSKAVKPWREAVVYAAREELSKSGMLYCSEKLHCRGVAGPVAVEMIFTLPKPKSAKRGSVPSKRPDLDKLCRSTFDALVSAGAIEDDARCVRLFAAKVYPVFPRPILGFNGALDVPGAVIRITAVANA